jgi:hypothetical protein
LNTIHKERLLEEDQHKVKKARMCPGTIKILKTQGSIETESDEFG